MLPVVSIALPGLHEEQIFPTLYVRLGGVMPGLGETYEILFVDDGSRDASLALLKSFGAADPAIKIVSLSRNFGHQIAITCGLDHASREAVVSMDADLQDPLEVIPQLIAKWREGYDVIYAVREKRRGEGWFKRGTAAFFYRVLRLLMQIDILLNTGDFRLLRRRAVTALCSVPERSRFVRGLVSWIGYRQTGVTFARVERQAGKTKYPFRKILRFALDGITSFSFAPLQAAMYLGFVTAGSSFLYIVYTILLKLFTERTVPGWTSLMVAVLFVGGVQLIALWIIGEYLGRVYDEVQQRSLYLIKEEFGFDPIRRRAVAEHTFPQPSEDVPFRSLSRGK